MEKLSGTLTRKKKPQAHAEGAPHPEGQEYHENENEVDEVSTRISQNSNYKKKQKC